MPRVRKAHTSDLGFIPMTSITIKRSRSGRGATINPNDRVWWNEEFAIGIDGVDQYPITVTRRDLVENEAFYKEVLQRMWDNVPGDARENIWKDQIEDHPYLRTNMNGLASWDELLETRGVVDSNGKYMLENFKKSLLPEKPQKRPSSELEDETENELDVEKKKFKRDRALVPVTVQIEDVNYAIDDAEIAEIEIANLPPYVDEEAGDTIDDPIVLLQSDVGIVPENQTPEMQYQIVSLSPMNQKRKEPEKNKQKKGNIVDSQAAAPKRRKVPWDSEFRSETNTRMPRNDRSEFRSETNTGMPRNERPQESVPEVSLNADSNDNAIADELEKKKPWKWTKSWWAQKIRIPGWSFWSEGEFN